jgi:hypothetical protein
MSDNAPKRHHYVPQFYLRRFACTDDPNKVLVLEQHRDSLVADRKSIDRIGYEDALHDYFEARDARVDRGSSRRCACPVPARRA